MLHRIAQSLRVLLLAAGVLLLAWLPISFFVEIRCYVWSRSPSGAGRAVARDGYLSVLLAPKISREVQTRQFPLLEPRADDMQPPQKERAPTPPTSSGSSFNFDFDIDFDINRIDDFRNIRPVYKLLPSFQRGIDQLDATLPLWLPAVACLAWPATSFVVRRRKRKRGFSIDPAASAADPSSD